jgi:Predicted metal-binding integral membrane protein (DUF2182)
MEDQRSTNARVIPLWLRGLELLLSGDATLIWGLLFSAWGTVFIAVLTGNGNWLHADALTAHPYWGIGANGRGTRAAWELGFRHGLYCLGCCWALMLVMFSVGVAHLAGMLVLTAVMAIEKTSRWGRTLVPVFGVILLVWGGLTLVSGDAPTAILTNSRCFGW